MLYAIVGDDAVRDSLEVLFQAHGISVQTYPSKEDFLAKTPTPVTGCLLIDVDGEMTDAMEVFDGLRNTGIAVPVIILVDTPSPARGGRAAYPIILWKPTDPDNLIDIVSSLDDDQSQTGAPG